MRFALPAVAVIAVALTGCSHPAATTTSGASPAPTGSISRSTITAGSDGLTVRYLGDKGHVKTIRVEDFAR